eukprot:CAMPEP_0177169056 /NCGR_PEP_ID=MMETSP0367-20130122/9383_1 /TAXON_ID=447022 ORGANISM="Scrippsiella hangoei-like, Strain SHHI-4" /NCGR_SAMPLE_ID=MMETSP0367 /ASSEMBLY_ACC=CAM_ASM_000362 /LENGTH=444 /DNA_ID=CAMNT_0018615205 /DNA_START=1 /DNA_END=1335 /DNA_ORIENTATION=-
MEIKKLSHGGSDDLFPTENRLSGRGVALVPHACELGVAGRQPANLKDRAQGLWRGAVDASDLLGAAVCVASTLAGTVKLDCFGSLASCDLEPAALRFLPRVPSESGEEGEREDKLAASLLGLEPSAFRLAGQPGQVLSHDGDLWLVPGASGGFDALLQLRPRHPVVAKPEARCCRVGKHGPMGVMLETWSEVPMVEFPRLLQLMMGRHGSQLSAAKDARSGFLVEEPDEIVVFHCWHRVEGNEAMNSDSISLEQLLWLDVVDSLAETEPCEEELVPAPRIVFADEGVTSRSELLEEEKARTGFEDKEVLPEDAPRLASLSFLKQYVLPEVMKEEVLPRLMPDCAGGGAVVRVFSASLSDAPALASASAAALLASARATPLPATLDDLFADDVDFRVPPPWAAPGAGPAQDPLRLFDLTSVILLNERSGLAMAFHCLQAEDPCAS